MRKSKKSKKSKNKFGARKGKEKIDSVWTKLPPFDDMNSRWDNRGGGFLTVGCQSIRRSRGLSHKNSSFLNCWTTGKSRQYQSKKLFELSLGEGREAIRDMSWSLNYWRLLEELQRTTRKKTWSRGGLGRIKNSRVLTTKSEKIVVSFQNFHRIRGTLSLRLEDVSTTSAT